VNNTILSIIEHKIERIQKDSDAKQVKSILDRLSKIIIDNKYVDLQEKYDNLTKNYNEKVKLKMSINNRGYHDPNR